MRATARFWALATLPVVLTVWAVVLNRLIPLFAAVGICAWLLTQQYRFARHLVRTAEELTVDQELSSETAVRGRETYVLLTCSTDAVLPVHITVEPSPPTAADTDIQTLHIGPDSEVAMTRAAISWPVAGSFTFGSATVTVRDALGLFVQRFRRGNRPTMSVEAPETGDIHVGKGGSPVAVGFGEKEVDQAGKGNEPQQVREYIPGDNIRQIDWKATARLDETHVREFTGQSERQTLLFVDHRASMSAGPAANTKMDLARELALSIARTARDATNPLGCYTVGDGGLTGSFDPLKRAGHHEQIRRHLRRLEVSTAADQQSGSGSDGLEPDNSNRFTRQIDAGEVRRAQTRLTAAETTMGRQLTPFLEGANTVIDAIAKDQLFKVVDSVTARRGGTTWTMIISDDSRRLELREAVKSARHHGGPVFVFVLPSVLYETGVLANVDSAYAAYLDFEEYRASLASLEGVSAFEVGPADRLESLLTAGQQSTQSTGD